MEIKQNFFENKENAPKHYEALIVSPGYADKKHYSGLGIDTRIRDVMAALFFFMGKTDKIVVGGGMIHEMPVPFAELMKKHLVKLGIPENVIETEQDTYDTVSQIKWIKEKSNFNGNVGLVTDSGQAMHIKALLPRFDLKENLDVLEIEKMVFDLNDKDKEHILSFLKKFHDSNYWKYWWVEREFMLALLAKCDPNGKIVKAIAELWRKPRQEVDDNVL